MAIRDPEGARAQSVDDFMDRAVTAAEEDPLAPLLPGPVNDLDAIQALPFSMLSGPEAGEAIRDSLIAEIKALRAEVRASVPTLSAGLTETQWTQAKAALLDHMAAGGVDDLLGAIDQRLSARFPDLGDQ